MLYQISRGGQTYGPYTLTDLKRYVESGHVLLNDLAKSDEMPEWVPVAQIVNPAGVPPFAPLMPVAPPIYAAPYSQPQPQQPVYKAIAQYPDPPNLHWLLVVVIDLFTSYLFQIVWNLIVAAWVRRVQPSSKALFHYIAGYFLFFVFMVLYIPTLMDAVHHAMANEIGYQPRVEHPLLITMSWFACWIFRILARFDVRRSLEDHFNTVEPMGFRMSGVFTFFFGGLYIQSQLNRINEIKRGMRYSQYGR